VRVAKVALLIFTVLSGWRSCGVVITKFSDHVVTFRSSPTVFADTPVPASASTLILAGKPLRAMSSAAMLLHLYRGIESSLTCRGAAAQRDELARPDAKCHLIPPAGRASEGYHPHWSVSGFTSHRKSINPVAGLNGRGRTSRRCHNADSPRPFLRRRGGVDMRGAKRFGDRHQFFQYLSMRSFHCVATTHDIRWQRDQWAARFAVVEVVSGEVGVNDALATRLARHP
jgi:hypothetical protein